MPGTVGFVPLYVSWTLQESLLTPHHRPQRRDDGAWSLSDWEVASDVGTLEVRRTGSDADEGLRVVAVAAWHFYDASGPDSALDTSGLDDIGRPVAGTASEGSDMDIGSSASGATTPATNV